MAPRPAPSSSPSASPVGVAHLYETIERAAERLSLDPEALRARCRRGARKEGKDIVAYLGAGIAAFKFGRSWRVRFPAG